MSDPAAFARKSKDYKKLKQQNKEITASRDFYKRRCDVLEEILRSIDANLIPPRSIWGQNQFIREFRRGYISPPVTATVPTFDLAFSRECHRNSQVAPNGRRWSNHMILFCYLLRSLGAKCYDYMRNMITLPAKKTLYLHFQSVTQEWRSNLLHVTGVHGICTLLRKPDEVCTDTIIEATLGVDAMSMDPVQEDCNGARTGDNHVFLFHLMPLRCEFKPISVHIMTKRGGNADVAVRERLQLLIAALQEEKVVVKYVATDGDSGYASLHDQMFDVWWPTYLHSGLEAAVDLISPLKQPKMVADFLHILKNARSRIINGRVTLCYNGARPFTSQDMDSILKLGKPLTDKSTTGKMKDSCALAIFTLENFFTLLESRHLEMAFYVLPYALWAAVVRNPVISTQTRRDFISFAIQIFEHHWRQLNNLKRSVVTENKSGNLIQFCCSRRHVVRILNSLVALLIELTQHPDNLALARMGTHDLECQFGVIRILCHYTHSWKMILKCFARLNVVTELATAFGHPLQPRDRDNIGGVKIRGDMELIYLEAEEINVPNVMQGVGLAIKKQGKAMESNTQEVVEELDEGVEPLLTIYGNSWKEAEPLG